MHVRVANGRYNRQEIHDGVRRLVTYHVGQELEVSDAVYAAYKDKFEAWEPAAAPGAKVGESGELPLGANGSGPLAENGAARSGEAEVLGPGDEGPTPIKPRKRRLPKPKTDEPPAAA
jgi:hypothetical protein